MWEMILEIKPTDFWPNLPRQKWLKWTVSEINKGNRTDTKEIVLYKGMYFKNLFSIKVRRSKRTPKLDEKEKTQSWTDP